MTTIDRSTLFKRLLTERILLLDGATGTLIQTHKLREEDYAVRASPTTPSDLKGNNDLLCLTRPDVVRSVHDAYLAAGADVVETNTFNNNYGNPSRRARSRRNDAHPGSRGIGFAMKSLGFAGSVLLGLVSCHVDAPLTPTVEESRDAPAAASDRAAEVAARLESAPWHLAEHFTLEPTPEGARNIGVFLAWNSTGVDDTASWVLRDGGRALAPTPSWVTEAGGTGAEVTWTPWDVDPQTPSDPYELMELQVKASADRGHTWQVTFASGLPRAHPLPSPRTWHTDVPLTGHFLFIGDTLAAQWTDGGQIRLATHAVSTDQPGWTRTLHPTEAGEPRCVVGSQRDGADGDVLVVACEVQTARRLWYERWALDVATGEVLARSVLAPELQAALSNNNGVAQRTFTDVPGAEGHRWRDATGAEITWVDRDLLRWLRADGVTVERELSLREYGRPTKHEWTPQVDVVGGRYLILERLNGPSSALVSPPVGQRRPTVYDLQRRTLLLGDGRNFEAANFGG